MQKLFLEALKDSLKNEKVAWEQEISTEQWKALFDLVREHKVLPLIFEPMPRIQPASEMRGAGWR